MTGAPTAPQMLLLLPPLLLLLLLHLHSAACEQFPPPAAESPQFWLQDSVSDLRATERLYDNVKRHRPKNVILFLGDGMGVTSVTAARILKGQQRGSAGEEAKLAFEKFPHVALAKTYNTDMQTPDSAGTGTAFLCGVKAKSGTVGVNQNVETNNCSSFSDDKKVTSFLEEAAAVGKSSGLVTTTTVTHATPAAAYSHCVSRMWEDDTARNAGVPNEQERQRCPDIASQLVAKSSQFSVVFGGGRLRFLPSNVTTNDRASGTMRNGSRSDGIHLVNAWKRAQGNRSFRYLETRDQLQSLRPEECDAALGLFATGHMQFHADNQLRDQNKEPTIEEMTRKAIQILGKNPNGFALLVEGGRIDHGHHLNSASRAMQDLLAFDSAIEAALQMTDPEETLIVVTADHSHVFSIGGWARRGNHILGKVRFSYFNMYNENGDALAFDNLPYTSLFYGDGPAAANRTGRDDITNVNTLQLNYRQQALVNFPFESHRSEDVPVYATGPGAHLFHSTHEQSYVANAIKHSICVGGFRQNGDCLSPKVGAVAKASAAAVMLLSAAAAAAAAAVLH